MHSKPIGTAGSAGPWYRQPRVVLALIAVVVLALDLVTKIVVVAKLDPADPVQIIGDTVTLHLIRNPGAAFSMATGLTWILTLIAIGVVVWIVRMGSRLRSMWWAVGLGLVLGGALGNLVDRLFRAPGPMQGHVVDFVSVGWFPIFNVADSAITCAAVLLVGLTVLGKEPYAGFGQGKHADLAAEPHTDPGKESRADASAPGQARTAPAQIKKGNADA